MGRSEAVKQKGRGHICRTRSTIDTSKKRIGTIRTERSWQPKVTLGLLTETIVAREGIGCDFERLDGFLFSPVESGQEQLQNELHAAPRAHVAGVELVQASPIASFDTGGCLRFPRQGQLHPRKYLAGLTKVIRDMRGKIFTETRADKMECGPPARVTRHRKVEITATDVVVATSTPFNDFVTMHTKQAPDMSYVLAF